MDFQIWQAAVTVSLKEQRRRPLASRFHSMSLHPFTTASVPTKARICPADSFLLPQSPSLNTRCASSLVGVFFELLQSPFYEAASSKFTLSSFNIHTADFLSHILAFLKHGAPRRRELVGKRGVLNPDAGEDQGDQGHIINQR